MHKIQLGLIVLMAGLACFYCTTTVSSPIASASTASTTNGTISVTSATLDSGSGCVTNVNTVIDASVPSWIANNFKCQVIYTDGTNYVFKSVNLPNTASYYYCGAQTKNGGCTNKGALYEALARTHTDSGSDAQADYNNAPVGAKTNYGAGTGVIATQNFVYKIPMTPTVKTGTLTSTQAGQASIGITVNGLAIFNNAAAPGDNLTTQAFTFDNYGGHPDGTNLYHHHSDTTKISSTMQNATLIGIMLDGYAVYDEYCDLNQGAGTFKPTASVATPTGTASNISGASNTTLDQLHGHTTTTKHFSTATYHYHYAYDQVASAAAITYGVLPNPASTDTKTLVGSYFYGTQGSVSN